MLNYRKNMLIARAKRNSNVIEYLLYMYQIEDIIRSFKFDINAIDQNIVQKHEQPADIKREIKTWYANLIDRMQQQNISRVGHLKELRTIVVELQTLHDQLVTSYSDKKYIELYDAVQPVLKELTVKTVGQDLINQIDVAVHGVYGFLVMRLKQQEIGEDTQAAITKITAFLAHLSMQFHKKEAGELEFSKEQKN